MRFYKQVGHVLKKDLLRFWPGLLGVAVLGAYHRFVGLPPTYSFGIPFAAEVPVFSMAVAALAAAVVQDDPAASTDALWRTTPLSPSAVFTAKSAFLGLFLCLIPALLQVQWVASLAPVADPGALVLDALLFQGGFLAAVALAASITPNLGAFLVLAGAAWLGLELFESSMMVRGGNRWPGAGEMLTRAWVMHLTGLVIGGTLLWHQYRTRHVVRTVVLSVAVFGGVTAGVEILQPDWASGPGVPTERIEYAGAESIGLTMNVLSRDTYSNSGSIQEMILATLETTGPGLLLSPTSTRTVFNGPKTDLETEAEPGGRWSPDGFDGGWSYPGMEAVGESAKRANRPSYLHVPLVEGSPGEIDDLRAATGFATTISVDAFRPTIESRIPLVEGESQVVSFGRIRIGEIARGDRSLDVEIRIDAAPGAMTLSAGITPSGYTSIVLHSPRYREFLMITGTGGGRSYEPPRSLTGGVRHDSYLTTLSFEPALFESDDIEIPDDWLDDVELVVVGTEYIGSFEHVERVDLPRWPESREHIDLRLSAGR